MRWPSRFMNRAGSVFFTVLSSLSTILGTALHEGRGWYGSLFLLASVMSMVASTAWMGKVYGWCPDENRPR